MKTIVVDINDREGLQKQIAALQPKEGDTLSFSPSNGDDIAVTVLLAVVSHMIETSKKRADFAAQVLNDLFQNKSLEEVEREIEQEYGISIEIKEKRKIEPLFESFPGVEYNPGWDEAYMNNLIEKGRKSWEGVDVQGFLNEMRGRD